MNIVALVAVACTVAGVALAGYGVIYVAMKRLGQMSDLADARNSDLADARDDARVEHGNLDFLRRELDTMKSAQAALAARTATAEAQRDVLVKAIRAMPVSAVSAALRAELVRMAAFVPGAPDPAAGDPPRREARPVLDLALERPSEH